MKSYVIYTASRIAHFQKIVELQIQNLPSTLTEDEAMTEGFVTLRHTAKLLEEMNTPYPHIISMDGDDLVGYTLVMLKEFNEVFPVLCLWLRTRSTLLGASSGLHAVRSTRLLILYLLFLDL